MTVSQVDIRTDEPGFARLIGHLEATYHPWELSCILLTQKLQHKSRVKISELLELAMESFFAVHPDERSDPKFSVEPFRKRILGAVASLQFRLVALSKDGKNEDAYMLVICDEDVRWSNQREDITNFINSQSSQG